MDHQTTKIYHLPNRFGFHYFPDFLHYTEKDIQRWLPILKENKTQWLAVLSPVNRAIPEEFIRSIADAGINLVICFNDILPDEIDWKDLELLVSSYGKWGAKFAVFGKHPNQKATWTKNQWGNPDLLKMFVQNFIRFSIICLENSIRPVFPILTPGGDYWDLAFLKIALSDIRKNAPPSVQNNFILSAVAWDWGKPLDWGAGGQERWPNVKPYKLPEKGQNHLGFRTYEWYSAIAQAVFEKDIPILLLQAGITSDPQTLDAKIQPSDLNNILAAYRLLKGENVYDALDESHLMHPINADVIGCAFYLLVSGSADYQACQWYSDDGQRLPPAQAVFIQERLNHEEKKGSEAEITHSEKKFQHNRYILIARELQAETAKLLKMLHPYIEKFRPMIGYSVKEAITSAMILAIVPAYDSEPPEFESIKNNGSLVKIIRPGEITAYLKEHYDAIH